MAEASGGGGTNAGVLLMLGLAYALLIGIALVIWIQARKEHRAANQK